MAVPMYKLTLKISDIIIKLFQKSADTGKPIIAKTNIEYERDALGYGQKQYKDSSARNNIKTSNKRWV